jgi:phosphatidylglycerol---prolipoprotein diacylglyceryl transferase
MFVNNLDPVLVHLGPVSIRYYGLVYVLGFLTAYLLLRHFAKKGKIKNLDEDKADSLIIWLVIGLIAGARIATMFFYEFKAFISNPLEIFYVWHGGMSFHGAIIGSFVAVLWFCKRNKVSFYQVADLLIIPAAFFLFLGRIANFINSELIGTITTPEKTPWCVVYEKVDSFCRHPSQIYESLYSLFIFGVLLAMHLKKKWKEGTIFWTFVLLYGILRFIFNFWRDDSIDSIYFLGVSTGQWLSILMIPIAAYFLYRINKK